ncbi:MAG TPA: IS110 family transposase [Sphingomicrobium sp.]|nr:IS110 family transposase [Sphingomicrobium sp.]
MAGSKYWVGMDLGWWETHVCILDDDGQTIAECASEASSTALLEALSVVPAEDIALIAVESGQGVHVVRKLRSAGMPIEIFEARKASKFLALRRNKTDASDARGLAELARLGQNTVSRVHVKSVECQQMRTQVLMRHKLVKLRVMVENSLRARFGMYGGRLTKSRTPEKVRQSAIDLIAQLKVEEGINLAPDVMPLLDIAESLGSYLKKLDRAFVVRASKDPVCRRLMSVPGVGALTALSFFSAVEDPLRFARSTDVAAYLGLVPRRYQSGGTSRTRGITKTGNKLTRMHLVNAAMVFNLHAPDCELKAWSTALHERIGAKRARVALARKLSIILLTIWRTEVPFELHPTRLREVGNDNAADLELDSKNLLSKKHLEASRTLERSNVLG